MSEWGTTRAERLSEQAQRWERIAAERGVRMDELQARAEAAEARCARLQQALEDSEGRVLAAGKRIETLSRERQVLVMRNSALQDKLLGLDTSPEALAAGTAPAEGQPDGSTEEESDA